MNKLVKAVFTCFIMIMVSHSVLAKKITLEAIYKEKAFSQKSVYGIRSMNDGEYYTVLESGSKIVKYNYASGKKEGVVFDLTSTVLKKKRMVGYTFGSDEKRLLIAVDKEAVYRHIYKARYYVYNLETKQVMPVSDNGKQLLATLSPDGKKVGFVRGNNIYIKDLTSGSEIAVTSDGEKNKVINGHPDWVYEEEFALSHGFYWDANSSKLAYYRFDESAVKQFTMPMYGALYPELYTFKYPKAGEKNSEVSIHVYDLASKKTVQINTGQEKDQYIPRIKWAKEEGKLAVVRLNRHQNHVELLVADAETGESEVIYDEETKYYISEVSDDFVTFLDDKKHFIVMSERDGYMHFYLYNMRGEMVSQITKGNWDVSQYIGYDQKSKMIYYQSYETSSVNKDVYKIKITGKGKKKLSTQKGVNGAEFSKGFKYYINKYSNSNAPMLVTLHNEEGKRIRVLEDNKRLRKTVEEYGFAKKEIFTVKIEAGVELNAWMIKPKDFDPNKKYPLFMYVYGGPESQNVVDGWGRRDAWYQMLVQQGYIVACVDNRGTDGRGEAFRKATYLQLGKYELEDQIGAAKYFGSLGYIDEHRIGIFGWSYGGYMSSLCMTRGAGVFKMGIAVAPVTNWRYYDSVYTERFMRSPKENEKGYDENSPIAYADKLKGKFLLMHGSADDNVHYQNTMEFITALVDAGKQFDLFIYPNDNHYISKKNNSIHIYTKMTNYIVENL